MDESGDVRVTRMPLLFADTLGRVPALLESSDPGARARLVPRTFEDDAEEAQWQRLATPELVHLIASRAELVRADLATMTWEEDGPGDTFSLTIPAAHRAAFEAALNGAVQSLYGSSGLSPAELAREPGELGDLERDIALLRIRWLTAFLGHLLLVQERAAAGEPASYEESDEDEGYADDEDVDDGENDDEDDAGETGGPERGTQ